MVLLQVVWIKTSDKKPQYIYIKCKCRKCVLWKHKSNSDWKDRICGLLNETQMHTYCIYHTLASTSAPPSSHPLSLTGHMQTVNTVAPLHSLAFCLYFLRQNNGYKSQSGKNKIWCKAQISVPEDWVNWLGGLVKKTTQERRRALLLAHLSSMHVPMF